MPDIIASASARGLWSGLSRMWYITSDIAPPSFPSDLFGNRDQGIGSFTQSGQLDAWYRGMQCDNAQGQIPPSRGKPILGPCFAQLVTI